MNLPFSKQVRDVYLHWNAGFTHLPGIETELSGGRTSETSFTVPQAAASAIWRVLSMVHLMFETVVTSEERVSDDGSTDRETLFIGSPGVRFGWNVGDAQIIGGLAVPITRFEDETTAGVLGYFSYELPFRR